MFEPTDAPQEPRREHLQYEAPRIADYGDLVALTAAGSSGRRADATFTNGEIVFFLSSAP